MNNAATVEGDLKEQPETERPSRLRRLGRGIQQAGRTILPYYVAALLLACSVQAVCLLLLWQPPQDWVSFAARFATSPAIAGLFALGAAIIGARSLGNQLTHTKDKSADEAWWQQFEWTTDRVIPSADVGARLPLSLAFDLMTSLSRSARVPFQKDAVEGILKHYLKDLEKDEDGSSSGQDQTTVPEAQELDAAGASSLGNLITALPSSSPTRESARRLLEAYEYENQVLKALRHLGFELQRQVGQPSGGVVFVNASERVVLEAKGAVTGHAMLERTINNVRRAMAIAEASRGVVVTPPTRFKIGLRDLSAEGISLLEWEPRLGSSELERQIKKVLQNGHN